MEDDDDLYGNDAPPDVKVEDSDEDKAMDEELESGEEEESSDSDIEFVLEKKETEPSAPPPNRYGAVKQEQGRATPVDSKAQQQTNGKAGQPQATPASQKLADGSTYPEQRTSTVDVNANPVYEPIGKPITQVDIEADLAEHTKPWRLPGSDPSDYFNYGFDEFTWTQYVIRQQGMAATLESQQAETQQFQQMFGGGMPGMAAAPSGPMAAAQVGNMPGMPNEQEMMQMAQMMMANGQDPSQMDFNTFMQQAGGGGAGAGGGFGGQNQGQGQGNFNNNNNYGGQNQGHGGGGGGGGGRGRRGGRW